MSNNLLTINTEVGGLLKGQHYLSTLIRRYDFILYLQRSSEELIFYIYQRFLVLQTFLCLFIKKVI